MHATELTGFDYTVMECGDYHVLQGAGEAGGVTAFYDHTTGVLVANLVLGHDGPLAGCGGGPSRFIPPACDAATQMDPPAVFSGRRH
jgi:hypothetical protein